MIRDPNQILLISSVLLLFSSLFISRGILIFLTLLCVGIVRVPYAGIGQIALQLRWVFFVLFGFYIFGDIFLGRTVRRIKFFDIPAIFFIFYAFLSVSYSPFPRLTLERATTILILYISVFWIIWKYAYDQGPEKVVILILRVMWIMFTASCLMIFVGPYRPFISGRFSGIFGNPNGLGVLSAIVLPASLWHFLESRRKSALFLFFMILFSLLLSGARGSLNAAVISLAYFGFSYKKGQRTLLFFISMIFIFIIIWIIETLAMQYFLSYIRVETIPTGAGRFEAWPKAIKLITEKPILGYGFGVEDKLFVLKRIVLREHPGGYFHNSYLGITLQLGLIGFILFFGPLFLLFFKELFRKDADTDAPLLRLALQASMLAGFVCAIFESWIYSVGNALVFPFWIQVMLLTFYHYRNKEKNAVEGT